MTSLPLFPSRSDFKELAEKGNLIPIWTEFVADYDTPIAVFEKIDNGVRSFLFESAESNDHVGRYSFLGSDPGIYFEARGRHIVIEENGRLREFESAVDPLTELQELMARYRAVALPGFPPFGGGAVSLLQMEIRQVHASARQLVVQVRLVREFGRQLPADAQGLIEVRRRLLEPT